MSFGETLVPWEKMSSTLLLPEQPANTVPKPAALARKHRITTGLEVKKMADRHRQGHQCGTDRCTRQMQQGRRRRSTAPRHWHCPPTRCPGRVVESVPDARSDLLSFGRIIARHRAAMLSAAFTSRHLCVREPNRLTSVADDRSAWSEAGRFRLERLRSAPSRAPASHQVVRRFI